MFAWGGCGVSFQCSSPALAIGGDLFEGREIHVGAVAAVARETGASSLTGRARFPA
jgi:hypothetical protein